MDHGAARRLIRPPGEVELDVAGAAAAARDEAKLAVGEIEKLLRVAAPGGRVGHLGVDAHRGAAGTVDRTDPEIALHHQRHRGAVGRIDRSVLPARAQRHVLPLARCAPGGVVGERAGCHVDGQDLAGAFAKAARVRLQRADGDGVPEIRPGRLAGREEVQGGRVGRRRAHRVHGARVEVVVESGAVLVLEGELRSVVRPGGRYLRAPEPGHGLLVPGARGRIVDVDLHDSVLVGRVGNLGAVRRPGRVALVVAVRGDRPRLLAVLHHPDLVQRLESDAPGVGRERGAHDAHHLELGSGVEVVPLPGVRVAGDREGGLERDVGRAAADGADLDLSVRRVEEPCGGRLREPDRIEGEDVVARPHPGGRARRQILHPELALGDGASRRDVDAELHVRDLVARG